VAIVETRTDGSVAFLTLNRPDARNALSMEMCDAIVGALTALDVPEVRAIVVRGEGSVFCSGTDFQAISGPGGIEFVGSFERMLEAVARHRLPTVALMHGAALGGGLQLATACDFRIAADDARIGIPSARLGILVNFENVRRLVMLVGVAVAKEVLMTSRVYSGVEAAAAGLVHKSAPVAEVEDAAVSLARHIASLAPLSVQGAKRALQVIADDSSSPRVRSPEGVEEIDRLVLEAYGSDDLQEGLTAMQEKRDPRFRGT
jgi:enoyl-CoA hydratase/carnithine racemase